MISAWPFYITQAYLIDKCLERVLELLLLYTQLLYIGKQTWGRKEILLIGIEIHYLCPTGPYATYVNYKPPDMTLNFRDRTFTVQYQNDNICS